MGMNAVYRSGADLPEVLPVFPLPGALLLPRMELPLNIFEPRYLALVDEAFRSGHRLIGMIQPEGDGPALFQVGCVGRITRLGETGDGRYLITLSGICRFKVAEELKVLTPYRQVRADYAPFTSDFDAGTGEDDVDREALLAALADFAQANDLSIDWDDVEKAENEPLVNALSLMSPFGPAEKQALLEAPDLASRAGILVTLTRIALAGPDDTPVQ